MMKKSWTLISGSVTTELLLHESVRSIAIPTVVIKVRILIFSITGLFYLLKTGLKSGY